MAHFRKTLDSFYPSKFVTFASCFTEIRKRPNLCKYRSDRKITKLDNLKKRDFRDGKDKGQKRHKGP